MSVVDFDQRGAAAWITLNRPEKANTLITESFALLTEAWEEVRTNPSIRVAVLTAVGTKDFCCGGDLGNFIPLGTGMKQRTPEEEAAAKIGGTREALLLDRPVFKPIIAAVNGRALGGGTEILEATDIRIASENALFSLPEPKVGIVPGAGSLVRLARQIPYAHAMYMMLTAQMITAQQALDFGLVSEVVPAERLAERAQELADLVAANAPLAMEAIKKTAFQTHTLPWEAAHAIESANTQVVTKSSDAKEGPKAFMEKRKPNFTGQ
jgi:enoyl-CoA hydratase